MTIKVFPSILAADFAHLAQEIQRAEEAGVDGLHIDVMDGHFVNNLSMGPAVLAAIKRSTSLFLDVHLMLYHPYEFVEAFIAAGADRITFHVEATEEVDEVIAFVKRCNKQVGLAVSPETSEEMLFSYLEKVDTVLFMTVTPGFGGQVFKEEVLKKIELTKQICDKQIREKAPSIQVDGGIDELSAGRCIAAGADELVSGTYLFEEGDMGEKVAKLRGL